MKGRASELQHGAYAPPTQRGIAPRSVPGPARGERHLWGSRPRPRHPLAPSGILREAGCGPPRPRVLSAATSATVWGRNQLLSHPRQGAEVTRAEFFPLPNGQMALNQFRSKWILGKALKHTQIKETLGHTVSKVEVSLWWLMALHQVTRFSK